MATLPLVAQMVAHTNTWCGPDLEKGLAGIADVHTERMLLPEPVTVEGERAMIERYAPQAAAKIALLNPTVVLFGCSSAAALLGSDGSRRLYEQLGVIAGAPVIGINPMLYRVLRREGITSVSLIAPYEWSLTGAVRDQLSAAGFSVASAACLEMPNNREVGLVSVERIVNFTLQNIAPEADGVLIACGNLRGYEAMTTIRERTGLPVVTANSAAVDELKLWLTENVAVAV